MREIIELACELCAQGEVGERGGENREGVVVEPSKGEVFEVMREVINQGVMESVAEGEEM